MDKSDNDQKVKIKKKKNKKHKGNNIQCVIVYTNKYGKIA